MAGSTRDDACKLYGMIEFHNRASETEPYKKLLRQEAKKDLLFNTEAKIAVLQDLLLLSTPGFGPCAPGDDLLQDLGTPSVTKTDAKVQLRPS
ncbi:hypothetical protein PSHT_02542 [Puccinia striiformis]|uniref:Uncharacterized protein n=1 Tax=Puccinia striiformis TaxID=27350 RepID=A0A2S4WHV3_9BASI|nr:hypothetical protein PSHT_02542 [Puccinia striiformis]